MTTANEAEVLEQAQALIAENAYQQAYGLLDAHQGTMAGNNRYDYLLGLAALGSQRPNIASFVLTRVVLRQPQHAEAQLALGRAYLSMEAYEKAQQHLEQALDLGLSAELEARAQQLLRQLETQLTEERSTTSAYLQAFIGYDSNANSATSEESFLGFSLSDNSRASASSMGAAEIGMSHHKPLGRWAMLNKASLRRNTFIEAPFVNHGVAQLATAAEHQGGKTHYRFGLQAFALRLNGEVNTVGSFIDLARRQVVNKKHAYLLSLRHGRLQHGEAYEIKDVEQSMVGLGYLYANAYRPSITLLSGRDEVLYAKSPYAREMLGMRVAINQPLTQSVKWVGQLSRLRSTYEQAFFGLYRYDDKRQVDVGLKAKMAKSWEGHFVLAAMDNRSTIPLYGYRRKTVTLSLKREW